MSRGSISHNYEYIPGYSNALQKINSSRILLKLRQQPIQTRQSTNNERDRRPLDPPPIVQIELENSSVQETQDFLQNPYLFMSVSLVNSTTNEDIITMNKSQNTLSGQTVSSMYKLKDINNQDGGFFVFWDLSVKLEGQFRLKFSIFEITGLFITNLKSIYSNVFQVYSSKTFPGMLESTFLSRSFSDQGVRIRIRKEHRVQITGSRKRKLSISQDDTLDLADTIDISSQQQRHQPPPIISPYSRPPWPNALENELQQERRRSSIMSTTSEDHRSPYRRPSLPFSPPHQAYDKYNRLHPHYTHGENYLYHHEKRLHYFNNNNRLMVPSPPYHHLFNNDTSRRLSMEDSNKIPLRRQSADPQYQPPSARLHSNVPRRMSLQQQQQQQQQNAPFLRAPPSSLNEEIIHLPPLRSMISPTTKQQQQEGIVEVDAAVAMMQLASRQQSEKNSAMIHFN